MVIRGTGSHIFCFLFIKITHFPLVALIQILAEDGDDSEYISGQIIKGEFFRSDCSKYYQGSWETYDEFVPVQEGVVWPEDCLHTYQSRYAQQKGSYHHVPVPKHTRQLADKGLVKHAVSTCPERGVFNRDKDEQE